MKIKTVLLIILGTLFLLWLVILNISTDGSPGKLPTKVMPDYSQATQVPQQSDADIIEDAKRAGIIYKMDGPTASCYVDPAIWSAMPVDQKRTLVKFVSLYFSRTAGGPYAQIRDKFDGHNLAETGTFGDVKIY
jgi:hypothetical protein